MKFSFPYTEKQKQMVNHIATILWIGTGTKTGKSLASYCWLIEGLLKDEAVAFVGPWFFRSRAAFDAIKNLLEPWIHSRAVKVNEARLQIVASGGGCLDFLSADNPNCLYGGNYHRLVLDEASRMPEAIYAASLTVISATRGRLRLFFNLELGVRNWAIRNLSRVQKLTPQERYDTGEDLMTFGTDTGLVDPVLVERLRKQMPESLWRALYLGEIPTSDSSLFRNLDKVFSGKELDEPEEGRRYVMGADLARKADWTQLTIVDDEGRVVACDRYNQVSWSVQVERAALLYRTFRCSKVIVDSTGIGDVVAEQFEASGMEVEPFVFTQPSRRLLIEELVLSCDNSEIRIPATEKFQVYRSELEAFEYQLDGAVTRYAVPSGVNDDAVMSLALAVHGFHSSRGALLGLVALLKNRAQQIAEGVRDAWGELVHPKPQPVLKPRILAVPTVEDVKAESFKKWQGRTREQAGPPCPACGSQATSYINGPRLRCNQCSAIDGVLPPKPIVADMCPVEGCNLKMTWTGGVLYCQQHGQPTGQDARWPVNGATFAQAEARRKLYSGRLH
jgi:hypothetical protein